MMRLKMQIVERTSTAYRSAWVSVMIYSFGRVSTSQHRPPHHSDALFYTQAALISHLS